MLGLTPGRGARALRAGHRLRRAARVRGPQAQELLVGHERPARVRGDDPGRRRHPAHRRGARRRRRRLPAEVLRRVQPAARRGQDDRARHARHGRRAALLPPGDADGARPDRRDRRPGARRRALPRAELPAASRRAEPRRSADDADDDRFGDGAARHHRHVVRGREGEPLDAVAAERGPGRQGDGRVPRARWSTRASASRSRTTSTSVVFAAQLGVDRRAHRRRSRPATRATLALRSATSSRPAATRHAAGRRARHRPRARRPPHPRDEVVRRRPAPLRHRRPRRPRPRAARSSASRSRRRARERASPRSSAIRAAGGAAHARARARFTGDWRRARPPDLDARLPRVPPAVLRLGARLRLAARPAAADVRRLLRRLHGVVDLGDGRPVLRRRRCWPGSCSSSSSARHGRRRRRGAGPREPRAQDPLPAHRHPAVGGRHGDADAGGQLDRGRRLHGHPAGAGAAQLARGDPRARDAARRSSSAWRCCCRRCSCATATSQPIWDVVLQAALLRDPDPLPDRDACPTTGRRS